MTTLARWEEPTIHRYPYAVDIVHELHAYDNSAGLMELVSTGTLTRCMTPGAWHQIHTYASTWPGNAHGHTFTAREHVDKSVPDTPQYDGLQARARRTIMAHMYTIMGE